MTDTYNQTGAVMNRWRHEGQVTEMPKAVYGDPMGNSRFSSRWIEDGSFFKLKNVRLSYVWPINNVFYPRGDFLGRCIQPVDVD